MTRKEWNKRPRRSSSFIRRSTRFAIYARDKFDCVYCRQVFPPPLDGEGLCLDHVIPRSKGGGNDPSNLVTACLSCNCKKQDALKQGLMGWVVSYDARKMRARRARQLKKPINRELGRWLARLAVEKKRRESKSLGKWLIKEDQNPKPFLYARTAIP